MPFTGVSGKVNRPKTLATKPMTENETIWFGWWRNIMFELPVPLPSSILIAGF
jgi:hypothetical protein